MMIAKEENSITLVLLPFSCLIREHIIHVGYLVAYCNLQ